MKLGIMQPYFFPYLGYFHLINSVDEWIIFDTPQYIRHGWVNRNRILHPNSGWLYITVPLVKHPRNTHINEIQIANQKDWKKRILAQLKHYKKQAPYYDETINLVEHCLANDETSLSRLNASILENVCAQLGIQFKIQFFSEMDLMLDSVNGPGDWAFEISKALNAKEYINPPGGAHLFDSDRFKQAGIKLTIQSFENLEYRTRRYDFVPGLSIIDVLMWNPLEEIQAHLNRTFEERAT